MPVRRDLGENLNRASGTPANSRWERDGRVSPVGLYDLQRQIRPVGDAYRKLLRSFGQISLLPHGEMFDLTAGAASLKVEA